MPFAPGNQEGKKKGPHKVSVKVKEAIINFLENNIDQIQDSFDTLKPAQKLQFISDILPYAAPKLQSIQSEVNQNIDGGITIRWEEPDTGQDKGSTSELPSVP